MSRALPILPASDPHQGVYESSDYRGDLRVSCEVVVVGSGPAGAVVAKELAEAGRDVVLLEEGPPFGPEDFVREPGESMQRTLREGGSRAARGNLITPTMQAIALGGGSLINSAICVRPPQFIFDKWTRQSGIEEINADTLRPHFERVEALLGVAPTRDEIQGKRNLLFKQGCDALGISSEPTWRNAQGCRGSGQCFTGCPNRAKMSTDVGYLPAALRAGARIYSCARAERLIVRGRRATTIEGHLVVPFSEEVRGSLKIEAKVVVLAAGCMATPLILLRSGIANGSGCVGRHLRLHPGLAVLAMFPEPIAPWQGATQGYHSLAYLEEGLKLEVLWSPPAVLATRMPGVGQDFQRHLLELAKMAPFDVICAGDASVGEVRARRGSLRPDIRYNMHQDDVKRIQKGVAILNDICWAAGAEAVLPGLFGMPETLSSPEQARVLREKELSPKDLIVASNHAFCTTRMARDPQKGVVDESGRCHELDNVYIADTGIFAASPGVNPMLLCMALADRIAQKIDARL